MDLFLQFFKSFCFHRKARIQPTSPKSWKTWCKFQLDENDPQNPVTPVEITKKKSVKTLLGTAVEIRNTHCISSSQVECVWTKKTGVALRKMSNIFLEIQEFGHFNIKDVYSKILFKSSGWIKDLRNWPAPEISSNEIPSPIWPYGSTTKSVRIKGCIFSAQHLRSHRLGVGMSWCRGRGEQRCENA